MGRLKAIKEKWGHKKENKEEKRSQKALGTPLQTKTDRVDGETPGQLTGGPATADNPRPVSGGQWGQGSGVAARLPFCTNGGRGLLPQSPPQIDRERGRPGGANGQVAGSLQEVSKKKNLFRRLATVPPPAPPSLSLGGAEAVPLQVNKRLWDVRRAPNGPDSSAALNARGGEGGPG